MIVKATEEPRPWTSTPCVLSAALSKAAGCNVFLKLDNLQPSGSFKSRGIGALMLRAATEAAASAPSGTTPSIHFYSSSGGNAGLACAAAAVTLNSPATVVVPLATSELMKTKLRSLGATVHQVGRSWFEADTYLREEILPKDPTGVYVPPFDHPDIWAGNATLVDELVQHDLPDMDIHAMVCAVGGGGLLNGLVDGIDANSWRGPKPAIIAVETEGADSLNACVREGKHVTLPGITSIATSMGAIRVCDKTWEYASTKPNVVSVVVSDKEAAMAAVRFADDARMIIEVSCGATLAVAYTGLLRKVLCGGRLTDAEWKEKNVVLVVCGGSAVNLDILEGYKKTYGDQ